MDDDERLTGNEHYLKQTPRERAEAAVKELQRENERLRHRVDTLERTNRAAATMLLHAAPANGKRR